ncbi:MAG TPA: hypothetical protein DEF51_20590, partial [Myxococcales bacterium]|nr:hypothetical protein [Myxococcales bacterium]
MTGALLFGCDDGEVVTEDAGADTGTTPTDGDVPPPECDAEGVVISGEIDADTRWSCPLYVLNGRIYVTNDAVLTIDAGTEIIGEPGVDGGSALIVTRGAQLNAVGTAAAPIVFTSGAPVGERVTGDWAGVALLGSATTN